ncbi:MAG TPA: twin-arginine translocase TatA/TatE family subunit [Fredinandcohnia sp.]|nr:twin-arginine translocase TatA/TatE family subunit [Fredinandcohnia sp.]
MPRPDLTDIAVILAVVLLVFGASKFPALGEALGRRLARRGRSD